MTTAGYIKKHNIKSVAVAESQINALYLWSLGITAVALFGTGTSYQYELLNKSGVLSFTTFFDGDIAGEKGRKRFRKAIRKDAIVVDYILPLGKDVNDLTRDEILALPME